MLRLSAGRDVRRTVAQAGPFTISNANEAPSVALLAPEPGAAHGSPLFVAWQAWDADGDPVLVDLDYRRGLGGWQPLVRGVAGARFFSWNTAALEPAGDYALRVTVRDPTGAAASDEITNLTLLANRPPQVRLVTPNQRTLLRGDAVILWQAEDPDDDRLLIDLYYSDDAGQTWLPLVEGIANTGYYTWQVSFLPMGARYRLRVVARDGFYRANDESDGTFVVGGTLPPTLLLLHPTDGARVVGVVPVEWDSGIRATTGLTASVAVRPSGETRWRPLVEGAPDDGFFAWDSASLPDGAYDLRVSISDGQDEAAAVAKVTVANQRNERPAVVLLAPAGGERWRGVREIVWQAWDGDGDPLLATVAISNDGGATWQELATVDARQGRYAWDTGSWHGVHPLLARVVVSDGQVTAQAITPAPFFLANGASGPGVRFTSPDDHGNLWRNDVVSWEAGSTGGAPLRVSLALGRDGNLAWRPVTEASYDAGEAVVPADWLTPGHSYRLRLVVDDGALRVGVLSSPFEVVTAGSEPPVVTLERPASGEAWSGEQEIRWQAETPDERDLQVTLELSRDGGATWFDLVRDQANTGRYAWDTTAVPNGVYRLRLTVGDAHAEKVIVSGPFTVENPGRSAPALSVISPQRGESWAGTREVRWRIAGRDDATLAVTLAYSLDGGGTWRRFAYNLPASEGYLWDTTTVPNAEAMWLRATLSDGLAPVAEVDTGPFAVRNARGPVVTLLAPQGGEEWAGKQYIAWFTAHEGGRTANTMLQYSADRGRTWETIAHDLPLRGSYRWDTATVADDADVLVRAYVSDGQQSAVGTTRAPVRLRNLQTRNEAPFYLP